MSWQGNKQNPAPNFHQESSVTGEKKISVNRGETVRRDKDTQKNFTVTLLDVDSAIIKHIEKFQLNVISDGARIHVPTIYASPEKWKSIQKDGYMRDYNGKLILPVIAFKRTSSDKDDSLNTFNRYLTHSVLKKYSEKNKYTPFDVLIGRNVPVNEVYDVTVPDYMVFTYHFIIWTEQTEQMNAIIERFNFETDDYWGELRGLKFRTTIDSFSHETELSVDQDRMVKTEFDLSVKGYLLPELQYGLDGGRMTTQKSLTPKKIIINTETVSSDFNFDNIDNNRKKWKNQKYANLDADQVIQSPPIEISSDVALKNYRESLSLFQTIVQTSQTGSFHLPAPTTSNSAGSEGWISYDSDYYYIYTQGSWKRVPINLFNGADSF